MPTSGQPPNTKHVAAIDVGSNTCGHGLWSAYHLNMVYVGRPAHNAPADIAAELCSARART